MSRDEDIRPRDVTGEVDAPDNCVKVPRADDVMSVWTQRHRPEARVKRFGVHAIGCSQRRADLRRDRRSRPSVHHIGIRRIPVGPSCVAGGARVHRWSGVLWINGQHFIGCRDDVLARFAVPNWEGHAVIALTGDIPVPVQSLDPSFIPRPHVFGVPFDPAPGINPDLLLVEQADEPLAGEQVLNVRSATFVDTDGVFDRFLGEDEASGTKVFQDACAGLLQCQTLIRARNRIHPAVRSDCHLQGQAVISPPANVRDIPEGATHYGASTLFRVGVRVGKDRDFDTKDWGPRGLANQVAVAIIGWIDENSDASGKEFRSGSGNLDCSRPVGMRL